ncbi:radical SAM protein [Actinosynnema sp. ALI-1.44]|nr:radical SAM protein [Actinosynnema sp. ALI-1.44]
MVWDVTYACPLRCTHCYSESGRRPARQLTPGEMIEVADALISLGPKAVAITGGEPLLIRTLPDVVRRFRAAGMGVTVYTGGWLLDRTAAVDLLTTCTRVNVSIDGATAEVNDRIRGRAGAFDRAMDALATLDTTYRELRGLDMALARLGIEVTVVRSNFLQLGEICGTLARGIPNLRSVAMSAAIPTGLASRTGFVEHELLTNEHFEELVSPEFADRLRACAPPGVRVAVTDNRFLRNDPASLAAGTVPMMQVEPDGAVRAMAIYEGTIGNLLTDDPAELWNRCVERWSDPFVVRTLSAAGTMESWAAAARRIDYRFGTDEDRARIDRRPAYLPH